MEMFQRELDIRGEIWVGQRYLEEIGMYMRIDVIILDENLQGESL